jgi:hypothetical protein
MKKIYLIALSALTLAVSAFGGNPQSQSSLPERSIVSHNQITGGRTSVNHAKRVTPHASQVSSVGCIYTDNFDGSNTVAALEARGYLTYYRGNPDSIGVVPIWFQGTTGTFPSFNGPDTGYVASNFNSVVGANDIDNWLVLPSLAVDSGDVVSFYSQSPIPDLTLGIFVDSLHVWYSAAGDTLPEDTTWVLLGEFEVNMLGMWEYKQFSIPETSPNGRIAIRYKVADGGPAGSTSNFVGIDQLVVFKPSDFDVIADEITSPVTGCQLTATESVTVRLINPGLMPATGFDLTYTVNGGTPVTETFSGSIPPGDTVPYTFTATADLSAANTYTIVVTSAYAADSNACNDKSDTAVVKNTLPIDPLTTAYTMGFEASEDFSGWVSEDNDGDGGWITTTATPLSGLVSMFKPGSGVDDDDYLFTTCLDLSTGSTYHLDFWYRNFETQNPCTLETVLSTSPSSANVTQVIDLSPTPSDTVAGTHQISTFTVANSGTYYVGFHAFSFQATGTSSIRLDNINIDNGNFIGIAENKFEHISIYPNPNNGIFQIKNPGGINGNVEIFNVSGQLVYSNVLGSLNGNSIDLSAQSAGVYSVRITSDKFVENHTIVIK